MKVTNPHAQAHADPAKLLALAEMLDDDRTFDFVVAAMSDARDTAPRHTFDRDSGEVLASVIDALRTAAVSAAA